MSDTDFDVGGHDDDSSKNFDDFQQEVMYSSTSNVMDGADEDDDAGGDEEQVGSWEIITDYETTIEIDSIDQYLLDAARTEIPIVLGRLKAKMFGGRSRNLNTIPASKFLQAWMDANFLGYIKQFVNKNLTGDPVSNSEILAFIQVELMLSFYRVSPSLYFDMDERSNFPSAGQGMDLRRYKEILGGLSRSGTSGQQLTHTWTPPMQHDREMAAAMDIVRTTGAELAFVSGVSQIALDDDLLRMRSKRVIDHGYSQINNPCKGLGVIHHAAVSVVTGLYIGAACRSTG
jgi:hypothetical protein